MKKLLVLLPMLLISSLMSGQSTTEDPNTTAIRLVILNDNGDVLLKKSTLGWVTIDTFFKERQTLNEVIESLSDTYGVSISTPNLKGVFTYKFKFKNSSSIRQLYVAQSTTNDLPTNKNVEFQWASKDEAVKKLKKTIPSLGQMVAQVLAYPEVVWGGSFLVDRENDELSSSQTEEFYPISNPSSFNTDSNYSLIERTLQKYMRGSSYNILDTLVSAFAENATLYLTNRDGVFKTYTPKEYSGFFKNGERGVFNDRQAKILAIDIVKDIATAKVEIAIPERDMLYIDLFLLKKFENEWKIISKTATRVDEAKNK